MRNHIHTLLTIFVVLFLCCNSMNRVQGAGLNVFSTSKVEADPKKEYNLEMTNGPWLIMVHSFSGPDSRDRAQQLVLELRKKYKMNAYVYDKVFQFNLTEGMKESEKRYVQNKKYIKTANEECAVVVGNFQSFDDSEFTKALQTIKSAQPDCLKSAKIPGVKQVSSKTELGPLAYAFGTTNPLLPPNYFSQKGAVDSFVERLNADSPYSLLNNPCKYTVRVATFTGNIRTRKYEEGSIVLKGEEEDDFAQSKLADAAMNATTLCKALRLKGYDAYEFHDRYSSVVTVGSFNEIGTPGPQGVEVFPQIAQIFERFKGKYVGATKAGQCGYIPKSIDGIPFDVQPMLVAVPKRQKDMLQAINNR